MEKIRVISLLMVLFTTCICFSCGKDEDNFNDKSAAELRTEMVGIWKCVQIITKETYEDKQIEIIETFDGHTLFYIFNSDGSGIEIQGEDENDDEGYGFIWNITKKDGVFNLFFSFTEFPGTEEYTISNLTSNVFEYEEYHENDEMKSIEKTTFIRIK